MAETSTPGAKQGQACAACHARKVRCDLNLHESTEGSCSNCRDAGKECIPHVRKRKHHHLENGAPSSKRSGETMRPRSSVDGNGSPSQQASYLGRANYMTSHVEIDEDDATQYQSPGARTGPLHSLQTRIRRHLSMIELPQKPVRETLLRNFLQRCRPFMPLVNESDLDKFDAQNSDSLLVTSMLVAGSIVSSAPQATEIGQRCYQRAKVLFYTGAEQNHIHTVMASIFLQWLNPSGPEHVSIDNSSFWLRISVGLAHQLGLHREPDHRVADAKLRRKIWWTLVSRDNQIATSHGRPRAISMEDSNVRPLRTDDFEANDEDALLFIQFVQITSLLGDITEHCRRGTLTDRKRIDLEDSLRRWLKDLPPSLRLHNPETGKLSAYNLKTRQLHVLYFVSLIILFRQEKTSQPPSPVGLLAASFISGIFEEYLNWEDISHLSVTSITFLMVAALLQLSYHRFPSLATNRAEEIQIITLSLTELKKRFPTAHGAERVVNQVMKHSTSLSDSAQPTRMVLSPEQKEFFAAFGPDLCRKWSTVFDGSATLLAGIGDFAAISRPTVQAPGQGSHARHDGALPTAGLETFSSKDQPLGADSVWNDTGPLGLDDSGFFADQMGLDTVGRWWWADWFPDTESDFLDESL